MPSTAHPVPLAPSQRRSREAAPEVDQDAVRQGWLASSPVARTIAVKVSAATRSCRSPVPIDERKGRPLLDRRPQAVRKTIQLADSTNPRSVHVNPGRHRTRQRGCRLTPTTTMTASPPVDLRAAIPVANGSTATPLTISRARCLRSPEAQVNTRVQGLRAPQGSPPAG
jgi:hypothetical protein